MSDILFDDPYYSDDGDGGTELYDDESPDYIGCLFPNECIMPGMHMVSECCTAEMYEQMSEEIGEP